MVQFNLNQRELTLKIVYYGPALSGKTTNLQAVHAMVPQGAAGRLMTLETRDDRTLFFDLLPVFFKTPTGFRVKVKLFTVPGQVIHDSTRKVVLQGADAIVFVADSQISESEANREAFRNLRENLAAHNLDMDAVPLVIQFNKRDLPNVRSEDELRMLEQRRRTPIYRATAINGIGVRETLEGLLDLLWDWMESHYQVSQKLRVSKAEFLQQLFLDWVPPRPPGGPST